MTFRTVVKEVAIEQGVYATFMPKPLVRPARARACTPTCRCSRATRTRSSTPAGQYQLSTIGRQFVAGLLKHAPEITAVTNQFVNSYKRLWGGDEAPSYLTWGHNNRSALVRVPLYKLGKGQSARVEYRAMDSAANPYLSFALLLAAGLKGIEERLRAAARGRRRRLEHHRRRAPRPRLRQPPRLARPRSGAHGRERARRRDPRRAGVRVRAGQQAPRVGRLPRPGDAVRAGQQPGDPLARQADRADA